MVTYRIHPSIGVARIGNSNEFYLAPTEIGRRPLMCDQEFGDDIYSENKNSIDVKEYKDEKGKVKKQAAKFRVYKYEEGNSQGIEVTTDDAEVERIEWTVHLANKKAAWYEFSEYEGNIMFGTDNSYKIRNIPKRNGDFTEDRKKLIIDPGYRKISEARKKKEFSRSSRKDDENAQKYENFSFPGDDSKPNYGMQVRSLGTMMTDSKGNLVVLGGNGDTGGDSPFAGFAGADSWHDDISDGSVTCTVYFKNKTNSGPLHAWIIVGPPSFVPEIVNISTLDDLMFDVHVRNFNLIPDMYDKDKWKENGGWRPDYVANFTRDIEPIIKRLGGYRWVANIPSMISFFAPTFDMKDNNTDPDSPIYKKRQKYFQYFRNPGNFEEGDPGDRSRFFSKDNPAVPLMPINSGSNSVANSPQLDKFATLTPTQYFLLGQWAKGLFNDNENPDSFGLSNHDRASVGNCVGIPMCPGIEVTWTTRNPDIYDKERGMSNLGPKSYMIKHRNVDEFKFTKYKDIEDYYSKNGLDPDRDETEAKNGCEPGDLTKRMAIPWQADLYECNIEYVSLSDGKNMNDVTGIPPPPSYYIYWWPPAAPWHVITGHHDNEKDEKDAGIPAGMPVLYARGITSHMQMVAGWWNLGFILNVNEGEDREDYPYFVERERNHDAFHVVSMSVDNVDNVFNPSNTGFMPVWYLKKEIEFEWYG